MVILRYRFCSVVTGADIPFNVSIGEELRLTHPNGVVIHPDCVMGVNCLFFQQVTLGKGGKKKGAPILGGQVDIDAGAEILRGIRTGNHVRSGANAVVLDDILDSCTAVGVPVRAIRRSGAAWHRG